MRIAGAIILPFLATFTAGSFGGWLIVMVNQELWRDWLGYLIIYGWPTLVAVTVLLFMFWPSTPPFKIERTPNPSHQRDKYPTEEK